MAWEWAREGPKQRGTEFFRAVREALTSLAHSAVCLDCNTTAWINRNTTSTMGCVTDIITTGDNDEPIFPVSRYRHYYYCDQCGSFELRPYEEQQEGFFGWLFRMKEFRGIRCAKCNTEYLFGTAFFNNHDANPRGFTMADVYRPQSRAFWLDGSIIDSSEDPTPPT